MAAAEAVLGAWPVPGSYGGEKACYLPQLDRIQLPVRQALHSAAGFDATWAPEVIHSTGHALRFKRDLSGRFASKAYPREELVAELGSVLLGDQLDIGSALDNPAAYLGHRLELLRKSPQVLYQVLGQALQVVEFVVGTELVSGGSSLGERQTPPRRSAGLPPASHVVPGVGAAADKGCARAFGPLDGPGPRVAGAVFFGDAAMKSRSWKLTCWFRLYRQTRGLRWFVALLWPLQGLPRRLAIELGLRRCERRWKRG